MEASVNPMYEGELTIPEMISFAENLGLSLISVISASRSPISKNYIEFDLSLRVYEESSSNRWFWFYWLQLSRILNQLDYEVLNLDKLPQEILLFLSTGLNAIYLNIINLLF